MSADIHLEREDEIATLVIDRPDKRNAISYEMYGRIPGLVREVDEDQGIKVLVVRGAGDRAFSAGADIAEFKSIRADSEGARIYNQAVQEAESALHGLGKPVVAMVHGFCIGGGCGLAMACDLRFSDEGGRFGITPANLGLVYSLESTKRLVDLVGPARAKYILFSGRQVMAPRAYEIGLVDEVHESSELESKTMEFVDVLRTRAQYSVRGTKHIIRLIGAGQVRDDAATIDLRNNSFDTEDYHEGVRAFLEKRPPHFTHA